MSLAYPSTLGYWRKTWNYLEENLEQVGILMELIDLQRFN